MEIVWLLALVIFAVCMILTHFYDRKRSRHITLTVELNLAIRRIFELEEEISHTRDNKRLTVLEHRLRSYEQLRDYLLDEINRLEGKRK